MQRNKLIQLIHVAKLQLGLTDEDYKAIISSIKADASSCTHLNLYQLDQLYTALKALGFKPQKTASSIPNKAPTKRSNNKASQAQLHYIRGLWALSSRSKDERSLNHMCQRITGIHRIEWLGKQDATKLILALRKLSSNSGYNPDHK